MQNGFVLKVIWKGTLRQVFIYLRSPPLLGFCPGVVKQFLGSVILPLPPPATDNIQLLNLSGGGREGVLNRRKCRWTHSGGNFLSDDDVCIDIFLSLCTDNSDVNSKTYIQLRRWIVTQVSIWFRFRLHLPASVKVLLWPKKIVFSFKNAMGIKQRRIWCCFWILWKGWKKFPTKKWDKNGVFDCFYCVQKFYDTNKQFLKKILLLIY
jgi:hypothetical protein